MQRYIQYLCIPEKDLFIHFLHFEKMRKVGRWGGKGP